MNPNDPLHWLGVHITGAGRAQLTGELLTAVGELIEALREIRMELLAQRARLEQAASRLAALERDIARFR
jgi:hypothetical protein